MTKSIKAKWRFFRIKCSNLHFIIMVHNCLVLKRLWRQFPPCIISQKYPFYDFLLLLLNSFEGAWARDKSFQNNWSFFLTEKKFWPPCPERLLIFTYKNFMTNHHKLWKKSHLTKKKLTFNIFFYLEYISFIAKLFRPK